MTKSHADMRMLTLAAQRAGFHVFEEEGLWWLRVPKRPRHPENVQGSWRTSERAWRAAAVIWLDAFADDGTHAVAAE